MFFFTELIQIKHLYISGLQGTVIVAALHPSSLDRIVIRLLLRLNMVQLFFGSLKGINKIMNKLGGTNMIIEGLT